MTAEVPRVVQRQDIRMLKSREDTYFAKKAEFRCVRPRVRSHQLDRYFSPVPQIASKKDSRVGSLAELAKNLITSFESISKQGLRFGHD